METVEAAAPPIREWFLAFADWGSNLWWHRFCRKGFRHIVAFGYDARADVWLVVDASVERLTVATIAPGRLDDMIADLWTRDAKILKCRVGTGGARPRLRVASCVTLAAHLLGLRRCAVLPYGLYRMLLRQGAVPAFGRPDERDQPGLHAAAPG